MQSGCSGEADAPCRPGHSCFFRVGAVWVEASLLVSHWRPDMQLGVLLHGDWPGLPAARWLSVCALPPVPLQPHKSAYACAGPPTSWPSCETRAASAATALPSSSPICWQ